MKTDELGDTYINPEKDGKRDIMGDKWMQREDIRTAETTRRREPHLETSKERLVKTGIHRPGAIGQTGRHKRDGGR